MRAIYCPGNQAFTETLNALYVDKTMLIDLVNARINSPDRYICVTRPRRFGKTFAAKMLTAYYDRSCDSEALFAPLKISKSPSFLQHLNKYHVLRLDGTSWISDETYRLVDGKRIPKIDLVKAMRSDIREELLTEYPKAGTKKSRLITILKNIVSATGTKFIVILDEWDAFLREFPDNEQLKDSYLSFLRGLFKVPESDSLFAAVYMTGILPIKRYNTESALSDFTEITMLSPVATADLFGFTEEEVRQYLSDTNLSFEDVAAWYDGYQVRGLHIFNPFSISKAREMEEIGDYWVQSSSYESLLKYISMNFEGLYDDIDNLLKGIPASFDPAYFANDLSEINSKDDVLTLLVHLGYLTFDPSTKKVLIPNHEIYSQFKRTIRLSKRTELYQKIERSDQLLKAILVQNAPQTADLIAQSHAACSSLTTYNNHEDLKSTIREALLTAADSYLRWEEFPSGKGIADILYFPKKYTRSPAILIELKMNRSTKSAIKQIKDRNYPERLMGYGGEILLVGISYYSKSQKHKCIIERFDMKNGTLIPS